MKDQKNRLTKKRSVEGKNSVRGWKIKPVWVSFVFLPECFPSTDWSLSFYRKSSRRVDSPALHRITQSQSQDMDLPSRVNTAATLHSIQFALHHRHTAHPPAVLLIHAAPPAHGAFEWQRRNVWFHIHLSSDTSLCGTSSTSTRGKKEGNDLSFSNRD